MTNNSNSHIHFENVGLRSTTKTKQKTLLFISIMEIIEWEPPFQVVYLWTAVISSLLPAHMKGWLITEAASLSSSTAAKCVGLFDAFNEILTSWREQTPVNMEQFLIVPSFVLVC